MLSLIIMSIGVSMEKWFAGIEAGGTKFNCMIAKDPHQILAESQFPTLAPDVTIRRVCSFLKEQIDRKGIQLERIGLGCFGPLDLNPASPSFGSITSTPKLPWRNTPILNMIQESLGVPTIIDTDVNAAAIGEGLWGAARGFDDFVYITIGTGIGGGVVVHGKPVHGLVHPELGHIVVNHDRSRDPYEGFCPYHHDCLEGLAAGPAIQYRWNTPPQLLPDEHPAWDLEAEYISQALQSIILTLSPEMIILGGGVLNHSGLIEKVRILTKTKLNRYVDSAVLETSIDQYIVTPGLGNRAGVLGSVALAAMSGH